MQAASDMSLITDRRKAMGIAMTLKQYLDAQGVRYEIMTHDKTSCSSLTAQASHIPGECLAKGVVLRRSNGYVMAVIPASRHVDLDEVCRRLDQSVDLASEDELGRLFADCDMGAVPPVAKAYGLEAIVDEDLDAQSEIYFEAGDHRTLVHIDGQGFRELMRDVPHARISC
jgi:Ala-tRNA(Pro) deacylase